MQRHFFATADDLLPVFEQVEGKHHLAYTLTGLLHSSVLTRVLSGATIPSLHSPAPYKAAVGCPKYLVTSSTAIVHVREVPQRSGGIRYAVDQLVNPDSITVWHGGFFGNNILLSGGIGSASDTDFAKQIYRAFASGIAKQFARIGAFYYVGAEAKALFEKGCRLTACADSPPEYDLVA